MLKKRGADLYDPENVKKGHSPTAELEQRQKMERRESLNTLLKMQGLTWEKPKYKPREATFHTNRERDRRADRWMQQTNGSFP